METQVYHSVGGKRDLYHFVLFPNEKLLLIWGKLTG